MPPMADRDEAAQQKTFVKFVMFGLGQERYAVPVLKAKEIIQSGKVFPLPKMPAFIEGILSLRGDIIPIVDLRKRFDLPAVGKTDESRIICTPIAPTPAASFARPTSDNKSACRAGSIAGATMAG